MLSRDLFDFLLGRGAARWASRLLGQVFRHDLLGGLLEPGAARHVDSSQGLRETNAAGSGVREGMRVFSRASRRAGACGAVHEQVSGRARVCALSPRLRQPVYR